MFRRSAENAPTEQMPERVDSVLGAELTWQGHVEGRGGLRIDGAFEGEIILQGIVVIGMKGRVTCEKIVADTIVVAGYVKGDLNARRVEINQTGRVWGNVLTTSFTTQEGAFLRGQITMEEELDLGFPSEKGSEKEIEPEMEAVPEDEMPSDED
ncbi:MAG: polymer-forming cytoskeletal protein [Anaerolineales bacterium]|nr:polymer-forming cytoskeletal protein [Anaerolineales bacterium]